MDGDAKVIALQHIPLPESPPANGDTLRYSATQDFKFSKFDDTRIGGQFAAPVGDDLYVVDTDEAASSWETATQLTVARMEHTATRLLDGRVLVAGGVDDSLGPVASAEIYDPATGLWTPTGSMPVARALHGAALLPDGKVLVAGGNGFDPSGGTNTAAVYDPEEETWTATVTMSYSRSLPTLTTLANGKVLVVGGAGDPELYDPGNGTWSSAGTLDNSRWLHVAVLLENGNVLVAGTVNGDPISAEIYDPDSNSWTPTGAMQQAHGAGMGALLPDGKVLVAGGTLNGGTFTESAEIYDPVAGIWSATDQMQVARALSIVVPLLNGDVLVAGGVTTEGESVASAEVYSHEQQSWSSVPPMVEPRFFSTGTLLESGKVLVAGGGDSFLGGATQSVELFTPGAEEAEIQGFTRVNYEGSTSSGTYFSDFLLAAPSAVVPGGTSLFATTVTGLGACSIVKFTPGSGIDDSAELGAAPARMTLAGDRLYITQPDSSQITSVDPDDLSVQEVLDYAGSCWGICTVPAKDERPVRVWACDNYNNLLVRISASTHQSDLTTSGGEEFTFQYPLDVLYASEPDKLWVLDGAAAASRFEPSNGVIYLHKCSPETGDVEATIDLPVVLDPILNVVLGFSYDATTDKLYTLGYAVTEEESGDADMYLSRFDGTSGAVEAHEKIATFALSDPAYFQLFADRGVVWLPNRETSKLDKYDGDTLALLASLTGSAQFQYAPLSGISSGDVEVVDGDATVVGLGHIALPESTPDVEGSYLAWDGDGSFVWAPPPSGGGGSALTATNAEYFDGVTTNRIFTGSPVSPGGVPTLEASGFGGATVIDSSLWIVRKWLDDVAVYSIGTDERSPRVVTLPLGTSPRGIVGTPGYAWVIANNGVWRINTSTFVATQVQSGISCAPGMIAYDSDNDEVWIRQDATNYLRKYNATTLETNFYDIGPALGGGYLSNFILVAYGSLWLTGAVGSKLYKFTTGTPTLVHAEYVVSPGLHGMAYDSVNYAIWCGSPDGQKLFRFDRETGVNTGSVSVVGTPKYVTYVPSVEKIFATGDGVTVDVVTDLGSTPTNGAFTTPDHGLVVSQFFVPGTDEVATLTNQDYITTLSPTSNTVSLSKFLPSKALWKVPSGAVITDGGSPSNLRANRDSNNIPIDNSLSGIVALGSDTGMNSLSGVRAEFGAILSGVNNGIVENAWGAVVAGGDNNIVSSIGSSIGGGSHNTAASVYSSIVGGYNNTVLGDYTTAGGASCFVGGNSATGFGNSVSATGTGACALGFEAKSGHSPDSFTIPAGGTLVTITGDATARFFDGDTVVIGADGDGVPVVGTFTVADEPLFADGATTFNLSATIDDVSTTGTIASTSQGNHCFSYGYQAQATQQSVAIGNFSIADFGGVAIGSSAEASLYGTAVGPFCTSEYTGALASGIGSTSRQDGERTHASTIAPWSGDNGEAQIRELVLHGRAAAGGTVSLQANDQSLLLVEGFTYSIELLVKARTTAGTFTGAEARTEKIVLDVDYSAASGMVVSDPLSMGVLGTLDCELSFTAAAPYLTITATNNHLTRPARVTVFARIVEQKIEAA